MAADDYSRTFEIKKRLLRRAWDGLSSRSGPEMIALILDRCRRGRTIPEDHAVALASIDDEEPRGVRALNLLEETNGSGRRHTARLENMASPSNAFH